jgi:hypothetical protein
MGRASQQQTVKIERGLFLVRYATAEDSERPPKVTVSPEPLGDDTISLVLHPDHDKAVLWEPDSCVVVRADRPGVLAVEVEALWPNGSTAASIRIEPLDQGRSRSLPNGKTALEKSSLRILGHVASIGDLIVNAGEWLAGPAAPSRVEGIAIEWSDMPNDLDLSYSVKTATGQMIPGRTSGPSTFAGTRGQALPIVGITLDLSGVDVANVQLEVEAIFLGAPAVRRTGMHISLAGPTGRETLVGLRVGLVRRGAVAQPEPSSAAPKPANRNQVRVFRGRPKPDQAAEG